MQITAVGFDQNRAVRRRISTDDNRRAAGKRHHAVDLQLLDKNHRDTANSEQNRRDFCPSNSLVRKMNPRQNESENRNHRLQNCRESRRNILFAPKNQTVVNGKLQNAR